MIKDQEQKIGDNSNAMQVAGDFNLTVNSTPFTEIEAIFTTLFKLNFPKIQDIARETAEQRVLDSLDELRKILEQRQEQIDVAKLQEPFVQYEMQAMIIDIARRGEKSNIDLLWEALCKMLTKDSPELLDLLAHQARKIIPLLTSKHIAHLGLQSLFHNFEYKINVEVYEDLLKADLDFGILLSEIPAANDITYNDVSYLNSLGALMPYGLRTEISTPKILSAMTIFQNKSFGDIERECTDLKLEYLLRFLELCKKNYLDSYGHTTLGKFIGRLSLKNVADVDLKSLSF